MARFDKKWLLVHVPAGIAVVALMAFGIVQCNGARNSEKDVAKTVETVKKARKALETSVALVDSLVVINKALLDKNVQQADSIVVLNDSIGVLNGRVVDLTNKNDSLVNANDSLTVALNDCAKSKQKKAKKQAPIKPIYNKPVLSNKPKKAPVYSPKPVKSEPQDRQLPISGVVLPKTEIELGHGAKNNGNVVVGNGCAKQSAAQTVTITLDDNAENNGNIVVGNGNTVSNTTVLPDTVVRFKRVKNTVVKCRIISTQRQYN